MLLSIIIFLFVGMALLGGLGLLLWFFQSPSTAPTAQPSFAPTPSVVLQPRNQPPSPDDRSKHWRGVVSTVDFLRSIGKTPDEIRGIVGPLTDSVLEKLLEVSSDAS